jgi:hypothetical protein
MRAQVKKENPELGAPGQEINCQINEIVGARWKSLTFEEWQPYEELGNKEKQRYAAEMAAYVPAEGFLKEPRVNAGGKKPSAKRPRTAYHHFMVSEIKRQKNFGELAVELGLRWRALTKEQKATYEEMALHSKRKYALQNMQGSRL